MGVVDTPEEIFYCRVVCGYVSVSSTAESSAKGKRNNIFKLLMSLHSKRT